MKVSKRSSYSLHITISTLFIFLIVVFGSFLSWQNYNKTAEILLDSGEKVFDQLKSELELDFNGIRKSVNQTVSFIATSEVEKAYSLDERLKFLPPLTIGLANEPNMSAIQIGYPNGDYFIIRPVSSAYVRKHFKAPNESKFIVDNINKDENDNRILLRIYFDKDLREISRQQPQKTEYDPRNRPW